MLILDETFEINNDYLIQRDFYLKFIVYSVGTIIFIDILRKQLPEINLLQLIPGFYLLLLFISFIFLVVLSDFFVRIPILIENNTSIGTKTVNKITLSTIVKFTFSFFILTLTISLYSILPLSLDSFNSYGEKTLENIWSFDEVLNLEFILLTILIFLSQIPGFIVNVIINESEIMKLPKYWKSISFFIFVLSGFLTPTIDGYTQLGFSSFAISFYLLVINVLVKRLTVKFNGTSILGF